MHHYHGYIGLGSNLDDPIAQIKTTLHDLATSAHCQLQQQSSLYASAPMGPQDQPDYVNAVAHITTSLEALALLDLLQSIELAHHRKREKRWGPRTLDLDLLLFGNQTIDHPRLQVPHVGLTERNFVLYPLSEIAPNLVLPDGMLLQQCLDQCPIADLRRINI